MRPRSQLAALVILVTAIGAYWMHARRERLSGTTRPDASATSLASSARSGSNDSRQAAPVPLASAPASGTRQPSAVPPNDFDRALTDVLAKYSGSRDWRFDRDEHGRVFKMSGALVKNVIPPGTTNQAFLKDLQASMGFQTPVVFERKEQMSGRFKVVDQNELLQTPDGPIPVYQASIRYLGNENGDAFLVLNELRPVDPDIRLNAQLSDAQALELARDHLADSSFQLTIQQPTVIYANAAPNQKATQVIAKRPGQTRLLLIGQDTRSVIWDTQISVN